MEAEEKEEKRRWPSRTWKASAPGGPLARRTGPWVRAALWAFRHLDNEGAVPPSPLARRLLELGREHPDKLTAVLLKIDGAGKGRRERQAKKAPAPEGSRRLRKLTLHSRLFESLGLELSRVPCLPAVVGIVGIAVSTNNGPAFLTLSSPAFPEVPEGQPIPEVSW